MQFTDIVKTMVPLLVIVGLLFGALYFVKKYGIKLRKNKKGSIAINVISSQMIMPRRFISVVKVEDKLMVLGISDHSITLLKEFDDKINQDKTEFDSDKNNFLNLLKKNLGFK